MMGVLLRLARFSNIPTVWTNCLAAWMMAGAPADWRILVLLLAGSLMYAGGCTLNDAFDAKFDRQHRTERPIPSGKISVRMVWGVGWMEMIGGLFLLRVFGGPTTLSGLALVIAVVLYDWLHKRSVWAVFLMGWCRAQLLVTAWLAGRAVGGQGETLLISNYTVALFAYIVGITLAARGESISQNSGKMSRLLPAGMAALLVPVLIPVILAQQGILALNRPAFPIAAALALVWIIFCVSILSKGGPEIGKSVSLLLAGIPLVDGIFLSLAHGWVGLALAFFVPVCLLLQRKFAAT